MHILNKTTHILCGLVILLGVSSTRAEHKSRQTPATFDVISSQVRVPSGHTKTVNLSSSTYIKKLIISAQGTYSSDATMQVLVNGDVKGTIHVPKHDPSYIVTVNATTSSISFMSLSGTINISAIKVVGKTSAHNSRNNSRPWRVGHKYSHGMYGSTAGTLAQDIALRVIDLVTEFTKYSSYKELGDVLLPLKKSAASVYAVSYGAGDYSVRMRSSLINLAQQLKMAGQFINQNFERSALFDLALELLSLKEELDYIIK